MGNMMKQVEKMQKQIMEAQQQLEQKLHELTVEATAGGGAVKVVLSGHRELKSITISPDVVDPEDVEMLQDLILAAVTEGMKQASDLAEAEAKKLPGLPKIPGLF